MDMFQRKVVGIEERIKQTVVNELEKNKKIIDDKLDIIMKENKSYAESVKGSLKANETTPNGVTNFKSILEEAKNEELVEEREKQKRSCNFIIHGLEEVSNDADELKDNDAALVELFFEKINTQARPTKVYRLGKPAPNKNRPLKLEMANNIDRDEKSQSTKGN